MVSSESSTLIIYQLHEKCRVTCRCKLWTPGGEELPTVVHLQVSDVRVFNYYYFYLLTIILCIAKLHVQYASPITHPGFVDIYDFLHS